MTARKADGWIICVLQVQVIAVVGSGTIGNGEVIRMILSLIVRKRRKMLISVFAHRASLILDRAACEITGPNLGKCVDLFGELHRFSFFLGGFNHCM